MKQIALITDFSIKDPFIGIMKSIIYSIAPEAIIVDITHEIPKYDIFYASFLLSHCAEYFPQGTTFCVVVDPGVGTDRNIIAASSGGQLFLAPDNGILTNIYKKNGFDNAVYVKNEDYFLKKISRTFQGRDIFAPVSANLSNGIELSRFGPVAEKISVLDIPSASFYENFVEGRFIFSDSFGNLTSNIPSCILKNKKIKSIKFSGHILDKISSCYEDCRDGFVAVINSFEHLEIALYKASAEDRLKNYKNIELIIEFV